MRHNLKLLKKFNKTPLFISLFVLVIFCTVFVFLYIKIDGNKKEAENAQTEWQTEANRRDEIRSLERSVKDIEVERNLLDSHFAQSSDVVPFLDTIERLASSVGAKPEIVSVNILKDNSGLVVELKASGNFQSVYKFLLLLENSPYELEFVSADIQNTEAQDAYDGKTENPTWEATFKIKLLSFVL
ncbi:MAG: hypothetical protein WC609_03430 [Candidatus Paceibacterota bacterium]|jgi:hypothetical protein